MLRPASSSKLFATGWVMKLWTGKKEKDRAVTQHMGWKISYLHDVCHGGRLTPIETTTTL